MISELIPTIFILDDEKSFLESLQILLSKEDYNVFCFDNEKDFFNHPMLCGVDLFIVDVSLKNSDGRIVVEDLEKMGIHSPTLFISGKDITHESFKHMRKRDSVFDFLRKPFSSDEILNRINILTKLSVQQKKLENKINTFEKSIWEIINFSTFFCLILDTKLNIKLINKKLAQTLGYKDEIELVGENWGKFIVKEEIAMIEHINKETIQGDTKYRENTNLIQTVDGVLINVKWFNSTLNHGLNYSFSIGIPLETDFNSEDNVDSIRNYFNDLLEKDKNIIKQLVDK